MRIEVMYSQAQGFYEPDISLPAWGDDEEYADYLKKLGGAPQASHGNIRGTHFTMHFTEDRPWKYVFELWSADEAIAYVFVDSKADALSLRLKLMSDLATADVFKFLDEKMGSVEDLLRQGLFDKGWKPFLQR